MKLGSGRIRLRVDRLPAWGAIWPQRRQARLGLLSLAIIVFSGLTYSTPLARRASHLWSRNKYLALLDGDLNPFRNTHLLLTSGLPIYDLKISRPQYLVLQGVVEQAKKQGWMDEDLKVWAHAKFIVADTTYHVKLRVRGDRATHWAGPKKSWRIKFEDARVDENGTVAKEPVCFHGKNQINLIIPSDRGYVLSYFANSLMRQAGLTTTRDQFVVLRINGILQGLYYEVEQFDKPLFAAQHRPETTVFTQNERAMHFETTTRYGTPIVSDASYDIGSMKRQVEPDGELAMSAMQILIDHCVHPTAESFGRVRAVLDWDKYLHLRALATLFNTSHIRFGSDNFKLYYDPSRGLLEPIPWDLTMSRMPNSPGTIDFWSGSGPDEIQRSTLLDPDARLQRNKILWSMVADGGDSLMAQYDAIHNRIRLLAWADVLTLPIQGLRMDRFRNDLDHNVRRVHKVLRMSEANVTYRLESEDRAAVEIAALNFSGIQLHSLQLADSLLLHGEYRLYEDVDGNGSLDPTDSLVARTQAESGQVRFTLERTIFPELAYRSNFIEGRYWQYLDTLAGRRRFFLVGNLATAHPHGFEWQPPKIEVEAANAVTGASIPAFMGQNPTAPAGNSIDITAVNATAPWDLAAVEMSRDEFLHHHPEFAAGRDPGTAELRGKVTLSAPVIVPKSVLLQVEPGTDVAMGPRASLVCYGGLVCSGTPEQPIRIHGDGNGEAWHSFAVVRPRNPVVMRYTHVQDAGQAQVNGILFTGGVAVHDGDAVFEHCSFTRMQSEDAVNVKNGKLTVRDCLVSGTASDAIDLDFCRGDISDSRFLDIGGDGVDLSGSPVTVSGCRFENIGDKGTSVGEDSHPILLNNLYRNCSIGVSCKDLSHPRAAFCTFVGNKLAIEAKRKKEFFGGGSGEFVDCVFSQNGTLLQEDAFSKGKIEVRNSLTDVPVTWPKCLTADFRFVAPDRDDFLLEPGSLPRARLESSWPGWAARDAAVAARGLPGIFSTPAPPAHDR